MKQAATNAAAEVWKRTNEYSDDHAKEMKAREKLGTQGVKWLDDFSAEDRRAFLDAASQTWKATAESAGGNAPAYRERVLKAIGR